jgi:hypothetical protein
MSDTVLMRNVFRTRYGKVDELVALLKKNEALARAMTPDFFATSGVQFRQLVDHGGEMFTVVTEMLTERKLFGPLMEAMDQMYQAVEFKVWFNQMVTCTESGSRELYNVHISPPAFANAQGKVAVRSVFQARYGKADAAVEHLLKENKFEQRHGIPPLAVYTDLTGPMFTVIASRDVASLAEWEQIQRKIDSLPEYSDWRKQLLGAVESGRREFYRIV